MTNGEDALDDAPDLYARVAVLESVLESHLSGEEDLETARNLIEPLDWQVTELLESVRELESKAKEVAVLTTNVSDTDYALRDVERRLRALEGSLDRLRAAGPQVPTVIAVGLSWWGAIIVGALGGAGSLLLYLWLLR